MFQLPFQTLTVANGHCNPPLVPYCMGQAVSSDTLNHNNAQDATMTHNLFFPKKDTENERSEIRGAATDPPRSPARRINSDKLAGLTVISSAIRRSASEVLSL